MQTRDFPSAYLVQCKVSLKDDKMPMLFQSPIILQLIAARANPADGFPFLGGNLGYESRPSVQKVVKRGLRSA